MRFDYNDNYYSVRYQGIPVDDYTSLVQAILTHENVGDISLPWSGAPISPSPLNSLELFTNPARLIS